MLDITDKITHKQYLDMDGEQAALLIAERFHPLQKLGCGRAKKGNGFRALNSPAPMRVRVDDRQTRSLVRFFQERDFLAVRRARGIVEIAPLIALSESADRWRVIGRFDEWRQLNRDVQVEIRQAG